MTEDHVIGKRFSEFPRAEYIDGDTKLIISRFDGSVYHSHSVTYSELSSYMLNKFRQMHNFGTMSYQSKGDYSKKNHTHDYTYADVIPYSTEGVEIAKFTFTDYNGVKNERSMYSTSNIRPKLKKPQNGELRFVYSDWRLNSTVIDINDENFDGWFVPNGKKIAWSEITNEKVLETKSTNPMTTSDGLYLQIPNLSSFIKLKSDRYLNYATEQAYRTTVAQHKHKIDTLSGYVKMKQKDKCYIPMSQNFWFSTDNTTVAYSNSHVIPNTVVSCVNNVTVEIETDVTLDDKKDVGANELYPTHDTIPILIYIL